MGNRQNGTKKNPNRVLIVVILVVVLAAILAGLRIHNKNAAQEGQTDTVKASATEAPASESSEATVTESPEATVTETPEATATESPKATATETPEASDTEDSEEESETEDTGLTFPYTVAEEKLTIDSIFQFSGPNPDCKDEVGQDISSIQLTNQSGKYLETADITVNLADGTEYIFHIEEIPDGKSVLAFDTTNQSYDGSAGVADIEVKAEYSEDASLKDEVLSVSGDEDGLHVKNISGENLKNIAVKYHCNMDDMYYGGRCYEGTVESLAAGESTVLDTSECYMGEAAVVNITY